MFFTTSAGIYNPLAYEPATLEARCAMGYHEIFVGEFRCDCGKRRYLWAEPALLISKSNMNIGIYGTATQESEKFFGAGS